MPRIHTVENLANGIADGLDIDTTLEHCYCDGGPNSYVEMQ